MGMKFFNIFGNSLGCSASGERLVSAARDGDLQEARALLEFNPRLAKYTTFGVRNSPLHYSAAHGHHEIVTLLLESGVDINLRNYRGQTALMQACQHGHWEAVLTLILFKANIHKVDCLNGGTALHLAALNGHSRCIRLILTDYIPSTTEFWNQIRKKGGDSLSKFNYRALSQVINKPADGGITALHMAALNGHVESVLLLLDLGASASEVTVEDGTTIDLIGGGSTALHYAACGGNAQCCQILIARGASLGAENSKGFTPLTIARLWHRNWLEEILSTQPEGPSELIPSPYLTLPLMSIVKVARECGWRRRSSLLSCEDPCVVCLERKCTVAAKGCNHEFCTNCALYLCSTNSTSTSTNAAPGSISCPLCRHSVVKFVKLSQTVPLDRGVGRSNSSLGFCHCSSELSDSSFLANARFCKPEICRIRSSSFGSSFRLFNCRGFPSIKMDSSCCIRGSDICSSLVPNVNSRKRLGFGRSPSPTERRERRGSLISGINLV